MKYKPPKTAQWILGRLINRKDGLSALGDIEEEFKDICSEKSPLTAKLWYWFQVVLSFTTVAGFYLYWSFTMFRNYLIITKRSLLKQKIYSFINIAGLAAGMACVILISLYVHKELSYDRFHEKSDQIYRLHHIYSNVGGPYGPFMAKDFPEILSCTRLC